MLVARPTDKLKKEAAMARPRLRKNKMELFRFREAPERMKKILKKAKTKSVTAAIRAAIDNFLKDSKWGNNDV
jgi:molecular chaperone DnaK (HSP70)